MNKSKEYDLRGVRLFVGYNDSNGKYSVSCWRKKISKEINGENDWRMIPVYHIPCYHTRFEAEEAAVNLAEKICAEFNF